MFETLDPAGGTWNWNCPGYLVAASFGAVVVGSGAFERQDVCIVWPFVVVVVIPVEMDEVVV